MSQKMDFLTQKMKDRIKVTQENRSEIKTLINEFMEVTHHTNRSAKMDSLIANIFDYLDHLLLATVSESGISGIYPSIEILRQELEEKLSKQYFFLQDLHAELVTSLEYFYKQAQKYSWYSLATTDPVNICSWVIELIDADTLFSASDKDVIRNKCTTLTKQTKNITKARGLTQIQEIQLDALRLIGNIIDHYYNDKNCSPYKFQLVKLLIKHPDYLHLPPT